MGQNGAALVPSAWRDDLFAGVRAEPGSPPTEGTVGDNEMFSAAHQAQVLVVLLSDIVTDEDRGDSESQMVRDPLRIVRKNKAVWVLDPFAEIRDCTGIVIRRTDAVDGMGLPCTEIIAPPHMQDN